MYNRYLTAAGQQDPPEPPVEVPAFSAQEQHAQPAGGLLTALSGRLSGFRIDADTLIVLAVVWFAIQDSGEEIDTELLIAVGILLLLGV